MSVAVPSALVAVPQLSVMAATQVIFSMVELASLVMIPTVRLVLIRTLALLVEMDIS